MFLGWICLKGILDNYCSDLKVAYVFWHGFFKMGGTKAYLKFICIMKGRARRREGWLQGRSEDKKTSPS